MASRAVNNSPIYIPPLGTKSKRLLPKSTQLHLVILSKKLEPTTMRRLYKSWNDERKSIEAEWIKYSIDHNATIAPEFQLMLYKDIKSWFEPGDIIENEWSQAAALGTSLMIRGIEKFSGQSIGTPPVELKIIEGWNPAFVEDFPELAASMERMFEVRSDFLIDKMSRANISAMNETLRRTIIEEGLGERGVADAVNNTIGLTEKQEAALSKFETRLKEAGVNRSKRKRALKAYSRRMNRYRARNIARTEMAEAFNGAMHETVNDAIRKGYVSKDIAKVWETASDERVCPFCGELHGTTIGFKDQYDVSKGATDLGSIYPPLHSSCRCIVIYEVFG